MSRLLNYTPKGAPCLSWAIRTARAICAGDIDAAYRARALGPSSLRPCEARAIVGAVKAGRERMGWDLDLTSLLWGPTDAQRRATGIEAHARATWAARVAS